MRNGARTNKIDYHACIDHRCPRGINCAHDETLTKRKPQKQEKYGQNKINWANRQLDRLKFWSR